MNYIFFIFLMFMLNFVSIKYNLSFNSLTYFLYIILGCKDIKFKYFTDNIVIDIFIF